MDDNVRFNSANLLANADEYKWKCFESNPRAVAPSHLPNLIKRTSACLFPLMGSINQTLSDQLEFNWNGLNIYNVNWSGAKTEPVEKHCTSIIEANTIIVLSGWMMDLDGKTHLWKTELEVVGRFSPLQWMELLEVFHIHQIIHV